MIVVCNAQNQWYPSLYTAVGCLAEGLGAIWQEAEARCLFGAPGPLLLMTLAPCA